MIVIMSCVMRMIEMMRCLVRMFGLMKSVMLLCDTKNRCNQEYG